MPTCFVIQPFDDENDRRYEDVYKPALEEAGVEPYRVDQDPSVAVPIESIESRIRESDICLADITTDNPNVWYELGFAFAVCRPVVMTCAEARVGKLPFDVQHRVVIKYATASPSDFERLRKDIVRRVVARLDYAQSRNDSDAAGSPIVTPSRSVSAGLPHGGLSREAQEILKAAAVGDGNILQFRNLGSPGVSLQAGKKSMIPTGADHRTVVSWTGGLEDLEEEGCVQDRGHERKLFEVTRKGYAVAEAILEHDRGGSE